MQTVVQGERKVLIFRSALPGMLLNYPVSTSVGKLDVSFQVGLLFLLLYVVVVKQAEEQPLTMLLGNNKTQRKKRLLQRLCQDRKQSQSHHYGPSHCLKISPKSLIFCCNCFDRFWSYSCVRQNPNSQTRMFTSKSFFFLHNCI